LKVCFLGKLAGFTLEKPAECTRRALNLSWMTYDSEGAEKSLPALMAHMG